MVRREEVSHVQYIRSVHTLSTSFTARVLPLLPIPRPPTHLSPLSHQHRLHRARHADSPEELRLQARLAAHPGRRRQARLALAHRRAVHPEVSRIRRLKP